MLRQPREVEAAAASESAERGVIVLDRLARRGDEPQRHQVGVVELRLGERPEGDPACGTRRDATWACRVEVTRKHRVPDRHRWVEGSAWHVESVSRKCL